MMWIYIGLLIVLGGIAIAGQVAYVRALERSGVTVPGFVRAWRFMNVGLLVLALVAVVAYLAVRS